MTFINRIGYLSFIIITGYFVDIFNQGYLFGYMLVLFMMVNNRQIVKLIDTDSIVLLIFSIAYALFYALNPFGGPQLIIIYGIFPFLFFLFGKYIAKRLNNHQETHSFLLFLMLAYSFVAVISVLINIYQEGFVRFERDVPLIWGNTINATGTAAMLFANMCIPAILLFSFKRIPKIATLILSVFFILSLIVSFRLGSRTQLVIFILTLVASLIFLMSKQAAHKKVFTFMICFFALNIVISYTTIDYDSDLLSSYAGRMESDEYGASTAGGRTERWVKSIENIFYKPLGWDVKEFGLSHNLWLDVARAGTVISLFFLLLYTWISTFRLVKLLRNHSVDNVLKNQFLVYFLAFMLQFFVEPILDGSFNLFVLFCFTNGLIKQIDTNSHFSSDKRNYVHV